ncbi:MAG: STY4851/ECs_5259 family protein, partial [Planctomycetota bacterium]
MSIWNRLGAFLGRRNLEKPDGRPLYAYKCLDREFNELLTAFRLAVRQGLRPGHLELGAEAMFCLLGAEWWRHHHSGGSWKWHGIFEELGWGDVNASAIRPIVRDGIKYWRRHLLDLPHGTGYLVTLACEGGLPLKLIQGEASSLKRYFKKLAVDFARYRPGGTSPEELARRAGEALPVSLRQEEVYHLCGQLMARIFELQGQVGESRTPILDLDRMDPHWRDSLPLVVEDDAARALLNGLVKDVQRAARGRPGGFRLIRRLERTAAGWLLSSELLCPKTVDSEHLAGLFELTDDQLSGRMNLSAVDSNGASSPLALLSELPNPDDDARTFQVEVPARVQRGRSGLIALHPYEVQLHADTASSEPVAVPGGNEPSELPWVFVQIKEQPDRFQLAGEGTVRTKADVALVLVGHACTSTLDEGSRLDQVGDIPEIERRIFELSGAARFIDEDGGCFRVHTSQEADEAYEYRLLGRKPPWGRRKPIFLGLPKLRVYRRTEERTVPHKTISPMQLEWRRAAAGSRWRGTPTGCRGSVLVRYRSGNTVFYQARAMVAPPEAQVRLEPGKTLDQGRIHLEQFCGDAVGIEAREGLETVVETRPDSTSQIVRCRCDGDTLPDVPLFVRWEDGAELPLSLPFPSRGARFINRRGNTLQSEAFLSLDELPGVRVMATSISDSERFRVVAKFVAHDTVPALTRVLHLEEMLQQVDAGVHELDLRRIQPHLESVFALSLDLEAMIQLRVEATRGDPIPRRVLFVKRFDLSLKLNKDDGTFRIAETEASADAMEKIADLRFEATRLWRPTAAAEDLAHTEPTSWTFDPAARAPGPWMITGWQDARLCTRPTLWEVAPSPHSSPEFVQEASAEES